MGMTIAVSRRTAAIEVHYDVLFHQKDASGKPYLIMEQDSPLKNQCKKVVPFRFTREAPSVIVDRTLSSNLLEYVSQIGESNLDAFEQIGEVGICRALLRYSFGKEVKQKRATIKESGNSLEAKIRALFEHETSPSTFMHPYQYADEDRARKSMFVREGKWRGLKIIFALPVIAAIPYSFYNTMLSKIRDPYENRFGESKEEERRSLVSSFMLGHPQAAAGIQRIYEAIKHSANASTYGLMLAGASLIHNSNYPKIAGFAQIWTGICGATMLWNLIRSRGRDSSGPISTLLDRKLYHTLQ